MDKNPMTFHGGGFQGDTEMSCQFEAVESRNDK